MRTTCPATTLLAVLSIGARDDGTAGGLDISDRLLLALADMKTDGNILPLPVLSVEKRILDAKKDFRKLADRIMRQMTRQDPSEA